MGYRIELIHVHVTPEESMRRATDRFRRGKDGSNGRFVQPAYIKDVLRTKPDKNYTKLATTLDPSNDAWAYYDNMVPHGTQAREVARAGNWGSAATIQVRGMTYISGHDGFGKRNEQKDHFPDSPAKVSEGGICKKESKPMKESLSADQEWERLTADLALCLADLTEDEYLILISKRKNYFVQFAAQGKFGMRVEAVSNAYLEAADDQLSADAYVRMGNLGWHIPNLLPESDHNPDGSPNFFMDLSNPVDFVAVSDLAVRTLRQVYGVGHPGNLKYKSFTSDGTQIRFPTLRVKRDG
jgi:hypothetical protein